MCTFISVEKIHKTKNEPRGAATSQLLFVAQKTVLTSTIQQAGEINQFDGLFETV